MKRIITICAAVLLAATVWAQSPQKMSYQAVIRNGSDVLVTNTQIGMEINIRQGSEAGMIVYTETQTPTTNANGLVSIEIGGGAAFSTINWASDNYYIETKTAVVAPLTAYTITGVSQLLSVPYAFHAKTAENGITTAQADAITANTAKVGYTDALVSTNANVVANTAKVGITTEQATKLTGIAEGAEVNVQADWNQTTNTADDYIKNKPTIPSVADGSETKVTAGTNVTVTGSGTTASPYVVNATGATSLTIGQSYQGGIIFWLDATGQHGLIAATADQSISIRWNNGTSRTTGTSGDGLYAGAMNTAMIVATQMADNQTGNFAAKVCADYSVTVSDVTYGDWYLPSKYELNLLYEQKAAIGGFSDFYYWSSTEHSFGTNAWLKYFADGEEGLDDKYQFYSVRAIRAF